MATQDTRRFLQNLRTSGVLDEAQLKAIEAWPVATAGDERALARELVAKGLLTDFQASLILAGRTQGFVIGSYVVLDRIGAGGMGRVYKAMHRQMRRTVALKVLPKSRRTDPHAQARFMREVRASARLNHPNIVTAFDVKDEGDLTYLVMEYVKGASLSDLIKTHGKLAPPQAAAIAHQVALALEHACERGVVHRDIKPGNILLTERGTVKVLDMGLARIEHPESDPDRPGTLTADGVVIGTVDYLSPEQAMDSHRVDTRADIYSLGCTLYHMLSGRVPFPGENVAEKLMKHQMREAEPVTTLAPDVPDELVTVVVRMMAKRPGDRFQTPAEVTQALQPWAGQSVAELVASVPAGGSGSPSPSTATGVPKPSKPAPAPQGPASAAPKPSKPAPAPPRRVPGSTSNRIGMKLRLIRAGEFVMGSPPGEGGRDDDEAQHRVRITQRFYMSVHPVTNDEYLEFNGDHHSGEYDGHSLTVGNHPVVNISWHDAAAFCAWLSEQEGRTYRLPTEAEWEYACRAGTTTPFNFGETISTDQANYDGTLTYGGGREGVYRTCTTPVGQFGPNAWGLCDMHGNVWEWCHDWYAKDYDATSVQTDPRGPGIGGARVFRGGSWYDDPSTCRSADRDKDNPDRRSGDLGFRVVCEIPGRGR